MKNNLKKSKPRQHNYHKPKKINMATIIIPTPLRKFTNQQSRLTVDGNNVKEAISELTLNFPDLKKHLFDEHGELRTFVNIFVGD